MESVGCEKRDGNREKPENFGRAQKMLAKDFEDIREQRDAGAEKNQANDIKRIGVLFAIVWQMAVDEIQADQADRDVYEEDQSPVKIRDDQAASDRTQHRADQPGNRDETHGADQFGLCEGAHHGQTAHRHHHGSAAALQYAAGHQRMNVAGDAAEK